MKNLFLVALVGLISLGSVLEAQAGRGCRKSRRCGGGCATQSYGGCGAGGCGAPAYTALPATHVAPVDPAPVEGEALPK